MDCMFLLLGLATISLFTYATRSIKDGAIFIVWATFVSFLASMSLFENFPISLAGVVLVTLLIGLFVYKRLKLKPVNQSLLLAIHIVRIPVEIVLFQLYLAGNIPILMTYKRWNFDIFFGLSALVLFVLLFFIGFSKIVRLLKIWSVAGIFSLASVVFMAMLSSPIPIQQFAFEQPNTALLYFPYVLLPSLIVPIVFLSHFLLLNNMHKEKNV